MNEMSDLNFIFHSDSSYGDSLSEMSRSRLYFSGKEE